MHVAESSLDQPADPATIDTEMKIIEPAVSRRRTHPKFDYPGAVTLSTALHELPTVELAVLFLPEKFHTLLDLRDSSAIFSKGNSEAIDVVLS